MTWVYYSNG